MGPICYFQRRLLVRTVVLGRASAPTGCLARHLARCAECDRVWRELSSVHSTLSRSLTAPSLSSDFDSSLRVRIKRARQISSGIGFSRVQPVVRCFVLAAGAVTVLALWLNYRHDGRARRPANPERATAGEVAAAVRAEHLKRGSALAAPAPSSRPWVAPVEAPSIRTAHFDSLLQRLRRLANRRARLVHLAGGSHQRRRVGTGLTAARLLARGAALQTGNLARAVGPQWADTAQPTWSEIGSTYALLGDFSHAADAYGCAYSLHADVDTAMAASENAERAGDMSQSWAYCAMALQ